MKPALLVIDMQKKYVLASEVKKQSAWAALEFINMAIQLFRDKGLPIICIQHQNKTAGVLPGTEGFENIEPLAIWPSDIHITKTYGNSFNKTNLEEVLRGFGVDTVILTGYCAENCVLSTCRGALDQDLLPVILRHATASGIPEHVRFVENVNEVISLGALRAMV
jgi:nicotinamidase-related amidase